MNTFFCENCQWLLSGVIPTIIAIIVSIIIYRRSRERKERKKPEIKGRKLLSKIRKKVLSAKTLNELKETEFELEEYKKTFPLTFEVSELDELIKRGISYEIANAAYGRMQYCLHPMGCLTAIIVIVVLLIILGAILIWIFTI